MGAHVLVFPLPAQGHINPMLQFAKRMASKGVQVTFINATTNSAAANSVQSPSALISIHHIEFQEGESIEDLDEYLKLFEEHIPVRLAKFIERRNHCQSSAPFLVYDSFMPWALDVARSSGIDGAPFFTQCWAVNSVFFHSLQGQFKAPFEVPSMPALGGSDLPSFITDKGRPYPGASRVALNQFSNIKEASLLFCNTFDKLEHEVIACMASQLCEVRTIGPTIPSVYLDKRLQDDIDYGLHLFKPNAANSIKWLDSKDDGSVVYVAFGSLAALGEGQMHELAWGLKRTNSPFLWVVRETEEAKLPKNFLQETAEQGLVVSWSPQLQLLAHRAVGCFVTHCGWNSTLEALSLGVPMVAMPQWTDQPTNAKFVADVWRVGVRVRADESGMSRKEEIVECIREVMEGERSTEIKNNSIKWKEMAIEAVCEGGSSDKNIDDFVGKLLLSTEIDGENGSK